MTLDNQLRQSPFFLALNILERSSGLLPCLFVEGLKVVEGIDALTKFALVSIEENEQILSYLFVVHSRSQIDDIVIYILKLSGELRMFCQKPFNGHLLPSTYFANVVFEKLFGCFKYCIL